MARTRNSTPINFYLVNLIELGEALKHATPNRVSGYCKQLLQSIENTIVYTQSFYSMKGFGISEFDDHLVLFDDNDENDDELIIVENNDQENEEDVDEDDEENEQDGEEGEKVIMAQLFGERNVPKLEKECFADYRMFSSFENVWTVLNQAFIHPVYLFRYVELCEFDTEVNDRVLLKVLSEEYQQYFSSETPRKKKKVSNDDDHNKEQNNEDDFNREVLEFIKKETSNLDWDEDLLGAYRKMMHKINPIDGDDRVGDGKPLDFSRLQHDKDMLFCILEYIGNVKTIFNFAISNHSFYEIFQNANKKNTLLKRIVKDWGLVFI